MPLLEDAKIIEFKWIFKTKGIQRVIIRDIRLIFLQKDFIKEMALIIKRLLLQF